MALRRSRGSSVANLALIFVNFPVDKNFQIQGPDFASNNLLILRWGVPGHVGGTFLRQGFPVMEEHVGGTHRKIGRPILFCFRYIPRREALFVAEA